ncbi:MAG: hypothetical protein DRP82_00760 [Planctomycetota bacterium]|nr:MAG: hypothetical protein DRP82_00760 [Planctomycetota bacterium]
MLNCTFNGNSAGQVGGAVFCYVDSDPTIINCAFIGNSVSDSGGAIYCYRSSPTLTNCTFSGNTASNGGGVFSGYSSHVTFNNCILWNNTASYGYEIYTYVSSTSCTLNYCCVDNSTGAYAGSGTVDDSNNCIHSDPQFVDAANGDYHLKSSSPCIDAGDNGLVPGDIMTDLDGNPRIVNGTVDIGAYERQ